MAVRITVFSIIAVVLGVGTFFLVYFYWKKIKEIFGITTPDSSAADASSATGAGRDQEEGTGKSSADAAQPRGDAAAAGGERREAGSSGGPGTSNRAGAVGSQRSSGTLSGPMIVVTAEDSSCGELMDYQSLAAACNHWAPENLIGQGAAAKVFSGELPRFGAIAVKRFHVEGQASGIPWNFDRELEALSQCRHPHVLEILGRAQTGPEQLIVMPLMQGGALSSAMPRMTWAPRAACLGQVVRAVSFLHGKKMIHRDIKSSNILMDRSLRHARLGDFGLAKDQVRGSRTHGTTGMVVGSPGYMAPELMMRPANQKTDSFAFGVVILEALTGLDAWDEKREAVALNDAAVADQRFKAELLDTKASWPDSEAEILGELAAKLTSFDPGARLTVLDMEQGSSYKEHITRADQACRALDNREGRELHAPTIIGAPMGGSGSV
eukprot:TRINITY_DN12023_c0_g2_i1.p1 TRINITY_DN12023_c0_g2~~TRINITY_DN12023_c0_g2_i1.p1  ORF type:complete len:438 (-),score=83.39 TRINITY_DN12023_c0_g2_i1:60-1373(-)